MAIFICKHENCANKDTAFDTGDMVCTSALCGGCGNMIDAEPDAGTT